MKTIRKELVLRVSRIIVIVCFIFGILTSGMFYFILKGNEEKNIAEITDGYSMGVQNAIEIFKANAKAAATNPRITDTNLSLAERKQELADLSKKYGFNDISVSDSKGKTYNNTDISDREYFKLAISGETNVSSPVIRKTDSSIILFVATKVNNGSGYDGIIYASLSSDVFSEMVNKIKVGNDGYGYVVDKTGTIVAHQNQDLVTNFMNYINKATEDSSYKNIAKAMQSVISNESGAENFRYDGKSNYLKYTKIEGTDGWSLCVNVNDFEMMQGFYVTVVLTVVLIIIGAVVGRRVAKNVAEGIATPIEQIKTRIELLSEGDLKSPVPSISKDNETKILASSLQTTINGINSYIVNIGETLASIANGNLNNDISIEYKGDFNPIKGSLINIENSLNEIMKNINDSAELVASTSEEISATTQTLSEGSTDQAGVVEELFASFNEISDKVSNNALNTEKVNDFFSDTKNIVDAGNKKMQDLMLAMKEINKSSNQIKEIINAIEDIASQTNLLALNAAIEAARAGEAGKGFAVVAEEVRVLAEQSSEAVRNTTEIIEESINVVERGEEFAKQTNDSLELVVKNVDEVALVIKDISEASKEQSISINQMTSGVDQISEVVQTNSATAEETAAAAQELAAQAQVLKEQIDKFNLK